MKMGFFSGTYLQHVQRKFLMRAHYHCFLLLAPSALGSVCIAGPHWGSQPALRQPVPQHSALGHQTAEHR